MIHAGGLRARPPYPERASYSQSKVVKTDLFFRPHFGGGLFPPKTEFFEGVKLGLATVAGGRTGHDDWEKLLLGIGFYQNSAALL